MSPTRILVATTNAQKITEVRQLLAEIQVVVVTPAELGPPVSQLNVAETGSTFTENAVLKARAFAHAGHLIALADDSGLEVTALGGKPGVHSARWVSGSDADRVQALLDKLKGVRDRSAQFVSTVCLYHPRTQQSHCFTGVVTGRIAEQPNGDAGFGYDPVFIPTGHTQTFAALGGDIKNQLSHRARAMKQVREFLATSQEFSN